MSTPAVPRRGDGIGIEYAHSVLRGVRLDHREPDRVQAIAEIPVTDPGDEQRVVDAFVRLRAELGERSVPTRIGMFPRGTSLQRIDATGLSGPELNRRRADLDRQFGITSTVLLDDGPRRWLYVVPWDAAAVRRVEEYAERGGFVDVSIDPGPLALVRVLGPDTTWVRRDASDGEAYRMIVDDGVLVAAITVDTIGHPHPDLTAADVPISFSLFDDHVDDAELAATVQRIADQAPAPAPSDRTAPELAFGSQRYPPYPPHDIRAAERQCVALGAAVGAAGLAGRLRPVDMMLPIPVDTDEALRPWALERLSDLPPTASSGTVGPFKRVLARVLPRRRPDR